MTSTWPTPAAPTWPTPATPQPARTPLAGRIILGGLGALIATAIVAGVLASGSKSSSDGDSFYASAGWTVSRAADLSVQMQQDDGVSRLQAQCAMKDIVGRVTWLKWQSLDEVGRLIVIRIAEDAC
jgi:hypothetical protein